MRFSTLQRLVIALLLLGAVLVGCVGWEPAKPPQPASLDPLASVVPIKGANGRGVGLVISCSLVLTPAHVAMPPPTWVHCTDGIWRVAELVEQWDRYPENLIVLRVAGPLPPPASIGPCQLGQSGSPLIANGRVVGLLSRGWVGFDRGPLISVPTVGFESRVPGR